MRAGNGSRIAKRSGSDGASTSASQGGSRGWARFAGEFALTLAIGAAFVAVGLGWAAAESALRQPREARAPIAYATAPMGSCETKIWLVDGYNALHAALLGGRDRSQWWSGARRRELLERVSGFETEAEIWIVFDGPEDPELREPSRGPRCVFAVSADDWLIDRVAQAEHPGEIAVVTADRKVAGRARGRGARIVSPREFFARCKG